MKTSTVLIAAKNLISDPECWIKGTSQKYLSNGKIGYCSVGAIVINNSFVESQQACKLFKSLLPTELTAGEWNDASTHAEVMAKFDEAIALAQSQGD